MPTYIGLSPLTGRVITDTAQLAASLRDLLTTPVGTRLMRRGYGSRIPDLIDAPLNGATLLRLSAAAYTAITRWEPRLQITRIQFQPSATTPGRLVATLTATRLDRPAGAAPISLEISL
jgi:uncharacterized protein